MSQATLSLRGRNPDILSCIANLSNDEVFTPPEFAQRMLDTLAEAWAADNGGASIWENAEVTFLDPCTKSGVFLREISKRLIKGLAPQIPDLQTRVDHILTRQIFGIGITELTAMLARRRCTVLSRQTAPIRLRAKPLLTLKWAISGSSALSTAGKTIDAFFAVLANPLWTGARPAKATPTHSFTAIT